jgi:hypothetical protein
MISACVSDYRTYKFCACDNYACVSADYQTNEHAYDASSDMFSYLDHCRTYRLCNVSFLKHVSFSLDYSLLSPPLLMDFQSDSSIWDSVPQMVLPFPVCDEYVLTIQLRMHDDDLMLLLAMHFSLHLYDILPKLLSFHVFCHMFSSYDEEERKEDHFFFESGQMLYDVFYERD